MAEFDAEGRLFSPAYGDVYHSPSGALGQAEHVFLRGNGLPGRWRGRGAFTVCETGFGLGLNFLALWRAWREDPQRPAALHVLAIEGHPFARADLAALLERYAPEPLAGLGRQLADRWPELLPGLHRLEFEGGAVTLTLGFGEAQALAPRLSARVDAFSWTASRPSAIPACGRRRCCAIWRRWPRRTPRWPPGPAPASCAAPCRKRASTCAAPRATAANGI